VPDVIVPEFIKQLHNRTPGWEDLIHDEAEFTLLVFEGRTIRGKAAIVHELNSWKGAFYKPVAEDVQRLDETTVLVRGFGQYPRQHRGHATGQVWWLDEVADGLVWRARGFTNEQAARAAYEKQFEDRLGN
jgi:hypothetical protein